MPLSILIWWPLAFALVGALAGARWAPRIVLGGSLITLGLAVYYLFAFNPHAPGLQFLTDETWIGSPFSVATDPFAAAYRSPSAGAPTTPTTGSSATRTAINVPQI